MKIKGAVSAKRRPPGGGRKKTLIERIFEKYVGREMTPAERVALQLKPSFEGRSERTLK
jgi:hypothetical protein